MTQPTNQIQSLYKSNGNGGYNYCVKVQNIEYWQCAGLTASYCATANLEPTPGIASHYSNMLRKALNDQCQLNQDQDTHSTRVSVSNFGEQKVKVLKNEFTSNMEKTEAIMQSIKNGATSFRSDLMHVLFGLHAQRGDDVRVHYAVMVGMSTQGEDCSKHQNGHQIALNITFYNGKLKQIEVYDPFMGFGICTQPENNNQGLKPGAVDQVWDYISETLLTVNKMLLDSSVEAAEVRPVLYRGIYQLNKETMTTVQQNIETMKKTTPDLTKNIQLNIKKTDPDDIVQAAQNEMSVHVKAKCSRQLDEAGNYWGAQGRMHDDPSTDITKNIDLTFK